MVDDSIDTLLLRQLYHASYKLLVSLDQFGMRGIDYKSKSNPLFLFLAQQFCVMEAIRVVARVEDSGILVEGSSSLTAKNWSTSKAKWTKMRTF